MARHGRRVEDTTPGKILALALLANAPIFVGFVLVPVLSGGDVAAARRFGPVVLFATPIAAILSIAFFVRAPSERRAHRASRIGVLLAGVALLLWLLVLIPSLRGFP